MLCGYVCHTHAQPCLSTGWALNRCFAWTFGAAAVLARGGGGGFYAAILEHSMIVLMPFGILCNM